jgi:hypothetical protein
MKLRLIQLAMFLCCLMLLEEGSISNIRAALDIYPLAFAEGEGENEEGIICFHACFASS